MNPVVTLTDAPSPEAAAAIGQGLGRYAFGTIPCDPPGTSRIFFVKELR